MFIRPESKELRDARKLAESGHFDVVDICVMMTGLTSVPFIVSALSGYKIAWPLLVFPLIFLVLSFVFKRSATVKAKETSSKYRSLKEKELSSRASALSLTVEEYENIREAISERRDSVILRGRAFEIHQDYETFDGERERGHRLLEAVVAGERVLVPAKF